jgi:hypothetical protein
MNGGIESEQSKASVFAKSTALTSLDGDFLVDIAGKTPNNARIYLLTRGVFLPGFSIWLLRHRVRL